ncbi:hypothetical protein IQ243_20530 [Nostocales cyanobacterium LEGE 11386]|nr:hypothetical protein [Nostocales cyanobacterium LEGE 11386]
MDEIWHPMEFKHPSGQIVRVIDAPEGVELFASDVCKILFPGLDFEIQKYNIELTQRNVSLDGVILSVHTMCALSIYSLDKYTGVNPVKRLAHWVRSNIIPALKKNSFRSYSQKYNFKNIDFKSKESLKNYLSEQGNEILGQDEVIDHYIHVIHKKIPLSADSPATMNQQEQYLRSRYLQIVKNVIREADRYEYLYHDLVLSSRDLLIAQELDLVVLVVLKRLYKTELPLDVIKQGLVLQALNSVLNNTSRFSYLKHVEPFYLRLLRYFSNEIIA